MVADPPTHDSVSRAWARFTNALEKDGDRYNTAGFFIERLTEIQKRYL